jgi:putative transposase
MRTLLNADREGSLPCLGEGNDRPGYPVAVLPPCVKEPANITKLLGYLQSQDCGFEVHESDSSDHAVELLRRTALAEGLHAVSERPVLHGDNGATMKATTVLAMLHWLRINPSYSRPRVSDDNAFVEALFRTAKYRPQFPKSGFADLHDARQWAGGFVSRYNHDHRHSGIRYVSPAQRHAGQDHAVLEARH